MKDTENLFRMAQDFEAYSTNQTTMNMAAMNCSISHIHTVDGKQKIIVVLRKTSSFPSIAHCIHSKFQTLYQSYLLILIPQVKYV